MKTGTHHRLPMRRTTSMTKFEADAVLEDVEILQPPPEEEHIDCVVLSPQERGATSPEARYQGMPVHIGGRLWKNSADLQAVETAPFLAACGLCKRRIGPGRDTFMYRYSKFALKISHLSLCSLLLRRSLASSPPLLRFGNKFALLSLSSHLLSSLVYYRKLALKISPFSRCNHLLRFDLPPESVLSSSPGGLKLCFHLFLLISELCLWNISPLFCIFC